MSIVGGMTSRVRSADTGPPARGAGLGVSRRLRQSWTHGSAPYGFRLLVGAATVAVEETIRLPKTILMYPMTLASQAAHVVMRFQQNLAELVIKGDSTLESIFPPKDEKPEWVDIR